MELKPCPFCGGEAKIEKPEGCTEYFAYCTVCLCSGSMASYATKQQAIASWNTRAERTCNVIDVINRVGECSVCGGYAKPDDSYCPSCGAKVVDE